MGRLQTTRYVPSASGVQGAIAQLRQVSPALYDGMVRLQQNYDLLHSRLTELQNGLQGFNNRAAPIAIHGAYIKDATIWNAKIKNLDGVKIFARSVTADKLAVGFGESLVLNASFEAGSETWTLVSASRVDSSPAASQGSWCVRSDAGAGSEVRIDLGANSPGNVMNADALPVKGGATMVMAVDAYVNDTTQNLWIGVVEYDAAGTGVAITPIIAGDVSAASLSMSANTWRRLSGKATLNANTRYVAIALRPNRTGIAAAWGAFDNVYLGEVVGTAWIADASIVDAHISNLSATKVNTGTLTVGGSGSNAIISALDAADAQIAWIGKRGSDYGGWFKTLGVGGASFAAAPLKTDASGSLSITDASISVSNASSKVEINTTLSLRATNLLTGATVSLSNGLVSAVTKGGGGGVGVQNGDSLNNYPYTSIGMYSGAGGGNIIAVVDTTNVLRFGVDDSAQVITVGWPPNFTGGTSTSATAGAQTLPANPEGFVNVLVGGAAKRMPYYPV